MPHDSFDIAIVGAGAAGIGAARALAGTGASFVVLEARGRPGGRAWTQTLATGDAVDLGCEWLHSADRNALVPLLQRQGSDIDKSPPPWSREDAQIGPHRAHMAGFGAAMERFREAVEAAEGADVACSALVDPADPMTPLVDAVSTYYSGAELEKVSAADLRAYEDSGVNWRVRGGLGAAIAALADGLPLHFGCEVRRIAHDGARLALETSRGRIEARAAIVTLPSDVLAQMPDLFAPALPDKTDAAVALPLGLADKVYLELLDPQAFPADSRAFGRFDTRATGAYHFRPLGRPLIEGFFGGDCAEAMERGGEAAAFDFALAELTGLFGADFRKQVRPLRFYGWRGDPFARGAYSYARPGLAGRRRDLAAPVDGRLFFAGEATSSDLFSTAHGAFLTGERAAREALGALSG